MSTEPTAIVTGDDGELIAEVPLRRRDVLAAVMAATKDERTRQVFEAPEPAERSGPFAAALLSPPAWHHEPLHRGVERSCVEQHEELFKNCHEPGCVLLKRIARALGWSVEMHGVKPPSGEDEAR